ncbi:hypothetical protein AVEN_211755-1 [Araneus ventricosus]|uniref:Uncharacterized protein n=1 Tax=Araneus ventricosus TaxID=182803 RepID=A0A4Y2S0C4_ARAVE|nr:hypothetical protein AVEN_211755-1 [Araneus ventricosus]
MGKGVLCPDLLIVKPRLSLGFRGRGGLVIRCRHRGRRSCHPPAGVVRKFGEGVSAQVPSSSSDHSSKSRGSSQNRHRDASKRCR